MFLRNIGIKENIRSIRSIRVRLPIHVSFMLIRVKNSPISAADSFLYSKIPQKNRIYSSDPSDPSVVKVMLYFRVNSVNSCSSSHSCLIHAYSCEKNPQNATKSYEIEKNPLSLANWTKWMHHFSR